LISKKVFCSNCAGLEKKNSDQTRCAPAGKAAERRGTERKREKERERERERESQSMVWHITII
jgi:hypothetical protein